jgi:uncharacterized protein
MESANRSLQRDPIQQREKLAAYLASQDEVVLAYLFGSWARGQAGSLSDVDIAVLLAGNPDEDHSLDRRMDLAADLNALLAGADVDVVILNQAPVALAYRVLRDGLLLSCRDQDVRIQYTARIVMEYLDFKPVLELFERAVLERARRGELTDGYSPYRGALEDYRRVRERLEGTGETDV